MQISIRFTNFWPGFSPEENFFTRYLKFLGHDVRVPTSKKDFVDIEFVSVFPKRSALLFSKLQELIRQNVSPVDRSLRNTSELIRDQKKSTYRIWYTGENVRPPVQDKSIDYFFSFDQDSFSGRNIYLPLWYLNLNWIENEIAESRTGVTIRINDLLSPREKCDTPEKFACVFISNPHPYRFAVIEELSKYGVVDVFGKAVGRPIAHKGSVARDYKYMICLENDSFPGYVTEKLLDAYVCGTVPIYWGNLGHDSHINKECFINLSDFESIEIMGKWISDEKYESMVGEPFLKKVPSIHLFEAAMSEMLSHISGHSDE